MSQPDVQADLGLRELEAQDTTRLLLLLNRFSVGMTAVVDNATGTDYASNPEILCVVALCRSGSQTFGELMAVSGLPRRSVAKLVRRLERDGLVMTGPALRDRRSTQVQLTATGRQKSETMSRELDDFFHKSRPLAKEIVRLFTSEEVVAHGASQPATGIDLLDATSKAGIEMATAVERRTRGGAVWGRQQVALLQIYASGTTRPGSLAGKVGLTSGGLTYLVNQLEKKGLVERRYGANPKDKRAVEIVVTEKGQRLAKKTIRGFDDIAPTLIRLFAVIRDRVQ